MATYPLTPEELAFAQSELSTTRARIEGEAAPAVPQRWRGIYAVEPFTDDGQLAETYADTNLEEDPLDAALVELAAVQLEYEKVRGVQAQALPRQPDTPLADLPTAAVRATRGEGSVDDEGKLIALVQAFLFKLKEEAALETEAQSLQVFHDHWLEGLDLVIKETNDAALAAVIDLVDRDWAGVWKYLETISEHLPGAVQELKVTVKKVTAIVWKWLVRTWADLVSKFGVSDEQVEEYKTKISEWVEGRATEILADKLWNASALKAEIAVIVGETAGRLGVGLEMPLDDAKRAVLKTGLEEIKVTATGYQRMCRGTVLALDLTDTVFDLGLIPIAAATTTLIFGALVATSLVLAGIIGHDALHDRTLEEEGVLPGMGPIAKRTLLGLVTG